MLISPFVIEVMLHCHYSPEPHPRAHVEGVQATLRDLLSEGLIEPVGDGAFCSTERGAAWVEMMCATPFPVQAWIDPRTRQS